MKKDKMNKVINKWIKAATKENPVTREELLIELLTNGAKVGAANSAITKAFKEAGILTTTSTSALKEAREWVTDYIKSEDFPGIDNFRDMRELAGEMTEKFDINDDAEKATKAAMKCVKEALESSNLPVPKKIHLGAVKGLMVDYFLDKAEAGEPTSVQGLADYLVENVEGGGENATDDLRQKLKVTAGTDYNFGYLLTNGLRLEDIN